MLFHSLIFFCSSIEYTWFWFFSSLQIKCTKINLSHKSTNTMLTKFSVFYFFCCSSSSSSIFFRGNHMQMKIEFIGNNKIWKWFRLQKLSLYFVFMWLHIAGIETVDETIFFSFRRNESRHSTLMKWKTTDFLFLHFRK